MPTRRRRGGGMFDWFTGKKEENPASPLPYSASQDAMNANPLNGPMGASGGRRSRRRSRRSRIRKRR